MNITAIHNLTEKPRLGVVTLLWVLCVWLGCVQVVEASRKNYDVELGRTSGNMYTQMDTWMGVNSDPQTLHKYLYTHADPVNNTDPTGNFTLGGLSIGIGTIARGISIASTAFDLFSLATSDQAPTAKEAGFAILMSMGGGGAKALSKIILKTCRKKKNSFEAGTLVTTVDGLVPIEEISIGDLVKSYNDELDTYEYKEVTHLIINKQEYRIYTLFLNNGDRIQATSGHHFYIEGDWVEARNIVSGTVLFVDGGEVIVEKTSYEEKVSTVYNLTVDVLHNYLVGNAGVLVHNDTPCEKVSKKAILKGIRLPTTGKIRFVPIKSWKVKNGLKGNSRTGYVDRFGNRWVKGPSRTAGEPFEWDVQLSSTGKIMLGWASRDGRHVNVSLKGKLTHK